MSTLTTFIYKGELYIRVIPAKYLFRSTLIHEVVNRRDVFAIRVSDSTLTIIPQNAAVTHTEHNLVQAAPNSIFKKSSTPNIPNPPKVITKKVPTAKDQLPLGI